MSEPAQTWQWPGYLHSVTDVLRVLHGGFDLVTTFHGRYRDTPRWALMRDGKYSPSGILNNNSASIVALEHCYESTTLEDGSFHYKLKPVPAPHPRRY